MRLHRHDELVEAIRLEVRRQLEPDIGEEILNDVATAALDALLAAVVEMGVGVPAISTRHKLKMKAPDETKYTDVEYLSASSENLEAVGDDALILRMEDRTDDA